MSDSLAIAQISERVEHLLLRHEELKRTNALLETEVRQLKAERDLLKARLDAAKTRLDAVIARLPDETNAPVKSET